jgi:hypothetical protein
MMTGVWSSTPRMLRIPRCSQRSQPLTRLMSPWSAPLDSTPVIPQLHHRAERACAVSALRPAAPWQDHHPGLQPTEPSVVVPTIGSPVSMPSVLLHVLETVGFAMQNRHRRNGHAQVTASIQKSASSLSASVARGREQQTTFTAASGATTPTLTREDLRQLAASPLHSSRAVSGVPRARQTVLCACFNLRPTPQASACNAVLG